MNTDSSNIGNGGVLSQVRGGQERVVAYCSYATILKAERTVLSSLTGGISYCENVRTYR